MRDERGFTLVEVLVAMSLFTIVLMAVLTTFDNFGDNQRKTTQRAEAQDTARTAIDRLARDMRNAVSAGSPVAESVERAAPDDLIFQTVGRATANANNLRGNIRVRYCLNAADPTNARLVRQQQVFAGAPTAMPTGAACPGPTTDGWSSTAFLGDRITNRRDGLNRPVFGYRFSPTTSTLLRDLVAVMPTLHVDANSAALSPAETALRSGVNLRNANQPPAAAFTITVQARRFILNASASDDPEHQPLTYQWYVDGATVPLTGVRVETEVLSIGEHSVRLVVSDPAGAKTEMTQTRSVL